MSRRAVPGVGTAATNRRGPAEGLDGLLRHTEVLDGWVVLEPPAHLATKLAALVDRPDSAPADKDRHEIMALLAQNVSTADAVGVVHDVSARPPAEVTQLIDRAFQYLRDLHLDRNQRRTLNNSPEAGTTTQSDSNPTPQHRPSQAGRAGDCPASTSDESPGRAHSDTQTPTPAAPTNREGMDAGRSEDSAQVSRTATTARRPPRGSLSMGWLPPGLRHWGRESGCMGSQPVLPTPRNT